jgi:hypothetical protein
MSDFTGLVAISFLFLMGSFLVVYIANSGSAVGAQVLTGVVRGTPISIGARRALLFQTYLPYQFGGFAIGAFVVFMELQIADTIGEVDIKLLAHLAAFLAACAAIPFLINGVLGTRNYRRFLRRIQRK